MRVEPRSLRADLAMQPGARKVPVACRGAHGNAEHLSRFFKRKADEIAQLYELGLARIIARQPIKCIMHREHFVSFPKWRGDLELFDVAMFDARAALELAADPQLLATREQTRASLFARADIRHAKQNALLQLYLLHPSRTHEELQSFAAIYPNANFMISNNLLTKVLTPSREEVIALDASALGAVQKWLLDPRFQKLRPHLEACRARLEEFVQEKAAE